MVSVIVALLLVGLVWLLKSNKEPDGDKNTEQNTQSLSQADKNTIYYDGKAYVYNKRKKNILFLGIDKD